MGDRQTFQVMPSTASGTPDASRSARALPFRHENEIARPHYYGVTFENGSRPRSRRPTTRRCSASRSPAATSNLIFDNVNNSGGADASTRRTAS